MHSLERPLPHQNPRRKKTRPCPLGAKPGKPLSHSPGGLDSTPPSGLLPLGMAGILSQTLERDEPVDAKAWFRTTWFVSILSLLVPFGLYQHYYDDVKNSLEVESILKKDVSERNSTIYSLYAKLDSLGIDCIFVSTCRENTTNIDLEIGRLLGYIEEDDEIINYINDELPGIVMLRDLAYICAFVGPPSCWFLYLSLTWILAGHVPFKKLKHGQSQPRP